jgi:UDPglucose--hexose-1-phosphate uridylyltransferase
MIALVDQPLAALHRRRLHKPDGRGLWLYAREPIEGELEAPVPDPTPVHPDPHLRWHPLRGEWVVYSGYRQHRTFLPPASDDPLAPTIDPTAPTELPAGPWEVAVFENRFPAFYSDTHAAPSSIVETEPARGACEVVVYTQAADSALSRLPLAHVELLVEVWADRTRELGARDDVAYVFPFENRGVEVGVTLHHPHGQIYAYPFVPPLAERMLEQQHAFMERSGGNLLEQHIAAELADGRRILFSDEEAVAFVPACARYAYEIWVAPRKATARFDELSARQIRSFARALKLALAKLDGLWGLPMPYIMGFHQAPSDGQPHPEAALHAQIYPAYRMRGRLKYLAGSEIGAGTFTADTLPETTAAELAAVEVELA